MLFRKNTVIPSPEAEKLLPELREYLKSTADARKKEEQESKKIRYSLPMDTGGQHAKYSIAFFDEPEESEILKAYHSWEKENSVKKSFSSEVIRIMNRKYSKTSAFYHAAGMDKRTFHKIKTDYGYKPSRKTALRCCIGLQLNPKEAEDLLGLAGFTLSPSEPYDLIIRFCLEKKIWNILDVNYMLSLYDLENLDE